MPGGDNLLLHCEEVSTNSGRRRPLREESSAEVLVDKVLIYEDT